MSTVSTPSTLSRFFRLSSLAPVRTRVAVVALAIGSALLPATSAEAQFGGRSGMATMFTPDFMMRDLPVFVDSLALEEWQRPVLEVLLQDYETSFNTAADGVRVKMSSFKDAAAGASADRVIDMISEPLIAWTNEKKKLREEFLTGVRGILGDSQKENWSTLERAIRREKSLPLGELSGESVDLTIVMREVQATPIALDAARAAVEQYEIQLDQALALRDAELDSSIGPLLKAMSRMDESGGVATQESIMQKRVAVRAAQEAGITTIRDALGSEFGAEFERRAMQRSFPQVFRPDPITPMLDGALALPDLTEDQKNKLLALQTQFGFDLRGAQATLVDAYRATEPGEPRRRTELARRKAAGETVQFSEAPQLEKAKQDREALFDRYRADIAGILSEQQQLAVPGFVKATAYDPAKDRPTDGGGKENLGGGGLGAAPGPGEGGARSSARPARPAGENAKPNRSLNPADTGVGSTNNPSAKPKSVD